MTNPDRLALSYLAAIGTTTSSPSQSPSPNINSIAEGSDSLAQAISSSAVLRNSQRPTYDNRAYALSDSHLFVSDSVLTETHAGFYQYEGSS
ncbi:hypothetical protein V502_07271 [Pseudogymnoascus sp. VKM F-4520 (FW-2644)]|nr:hypothetical protein V502_07271 [Pseudogymnoascus sp. VKM F-4520 (FW-2644)]